MSLSEKAPAIPASAHCADPVLTGLQGSVGDVSGGKASVDDASVTTRSEMPRAEVGRRPRCDRCQRPLSHCLCIHIPSLLNRTRVLVLQHPDEVKHPLNTARLAVLGLQNAELWVGEHFPALEQRLSKTPHAALLFPAKGKGQDGGRDWGRGRDKHHDRDFDPAAVPSGQAEDAYQLLIVPDGTWRKARKIVQANLVLHTLPRLSLPAGAPSEYRVRKATEPAAVSTLEAIVRALEKLEPGRSFQPVLAPLRALVQQQVQGMGEDVFRRHHMR